MSTIRSRFQNKTWTKGNYFISTDPSLVPITKLNEFFGTKDMHWTEPLPEDVLAETVTNSLCFGLYDRNSTAGSSDTGEFVGFARCVTDFTTLLYLTDVYTTPQIRGSGLGKWLMACVKEVMDEMPYVRRIIFITGDWERSVPFYEKVLGTTVIESRPPRLNEAGDSTAVLSRTGPGWPEH